MCEDDPEISVKAILMSLPTAHSQHCRDCKLRVRELLAVLYGDCQVNHAFGWPSEPAAYRGTQVGETLACVFDSLCRHRGYENFIRTPKMPPCDYYVSRPGFIVEFDESQHFTEPRRVTLGCYTPDLPVGFDLGEWARLCEFWNCHDPTPQDRDERRAWYDCLRDLLPCHYGLEPTIRLYAGAFAWCSLRPDSPADRRRFESLIRGSQTADR